MEYLQDKQNTQTITRQCPSCNGEHTPYYIQFNNTIKLCIHCITSTKKYYYLKFEDNLPILTKTISKPRKGKQLKIPKWKKKARSPSVVRFHTDIKRLGFRSYNDYLNGPHWASFRARYMRDTYQGQCGVCQFCEEKKDPLHLHHKTYIRLGRERFKDIYLLCSDCHELCHNIQKMAWKNKENSQQRGLRSATMQARAIVRNKK